MEYGDRKGNIPKAAIEDKLMTFPFLFILFLIFFKTASNENKEISNCLCKSCLSKRSTGDDMATP